MTSLLKIRENQVQLDTTLYYAQVQWKNSGRFAEKEKHYFELIPYAEQGTFEFSVLFEQEPYSGSIPDYVATQANSTLSGSNFGLKELR
jgi:hypothetical protein